MNINDILLYKEALSACGWSVIKTDELAELRAALDGAREVIEPLASEMGFVVSENNTRTEVCLHYDAAAWLEKYAPKKK